MPVSLNPDGFGKAGRDAQRLIQPKMQDIEMAWKGTQEEARGGQRENLGQWGGLGHVDQMSIGQQKSNHNTPSVPSLPLAPHLSQLLSK